jgi:hypothetical protein
MREGNSGAAAGGGAIYALGIFGAWVYFWQQADGFWEHVLAVLEGVVWARADGLRRVLGPPVTRMSALGAYSI